jgi:hypothetical protein
MFGSILLGLARNSESWNAVRGTVVDVVSLGLLKGLANTSCELGILDARHIENVYRSSGVSKYVM